MSEARAPSPAQINPPVGPFLPGLEVRVVVFSLRDERLQALLTPACPGSGSQGSFLELPGSRVPVEQSLEETATNGLLRLTGLREAYLEQLYTYGEAARRA